MFDFFKLVLLVTHLKCENKLKFFKLNDYLANASVDVDAEKNDDKDKKHSH